MFREQTEEIERFVVVMYRRTSQAHKVNDARKQLFANSNRQIENIPPTKAALFEHAKRAVYQAGHVWGQTILRDPQLPSPGLWGWKKENGQWVPFWTTLPEACKACRELIKCSCKGACKARCSCHKPTVLKSLSLCWKVYLMSFQ